MHISVLMHVSASIYQINVNIQFSFPI